MPEEVAAEEVLEAVCIKRLLRCHQKGEPVLVAPVRLLRPLLKLLRIAQDGVVRVLSSREGIILPPLCDKAPGLISIVPSLAALNKVRRDAALSGLILPDVIF